MATISLTLPTSGTVVAAGLHSANYATLQAAINGGLDNNNFAAGKIFDNTKIMQGGAVGGQALVWNVAASQWLPASVGGAPYRKTTAKAVNSIATAVDLLNSEITIAAGVMGATGILRFTAYGNWLQNSGGAASQPRFQLLLGGTTILDTGGSGANISSAATRSSWRLTAHIINATSASQTADLQLVLGSNLGTGAAIHNAFTVGVGEYQSVYNATNSFTFIAQGSNEGLTVNTANACALVLNVFNGSASATYETKLSSAYVEII